MGATRMGAVMAAIAAIAVAIPAVSTAGGQGDDRVKVATKLKGKHEVPGPGDPDGEGRAALFPKAEKRRICFKLRVEALNLVHAAHIHKGSPDVAGPIKLTLFEDKAGLDGNGDYQGCVKKVRRGLLRKIAKAPERFYVNVHTDGYPDGAIRGQLEPRG